MSWYYEWKPYVPIAQRRAQAVAYATKQAKKEKRTVNPVSLEGRQISRSFWGKAWCENLERYSDFANRLPRGRTYLRNGSVVDLHISSGTIKAVVAGSDVYRVTIAIGTLRAAIWKQILKDCSQSIESLMDLLQGRFDEGVMARLTQKKIGLFPHSKEIKIRCSCPDWAVLCKHAAAVLYGVGTRLDSDPECCSLCEMSIIWNSSGPQPRPKTSTARYGRFERDLVGRPGRDFWHRHREGRGGRQP